VASGTADSIWLMEEWRQEVIARGGSPLVINACLFGLWPRWKNPGMETMIRANTMLKWNSAVGVEAGNSDADCMTNLSTNGHIASTHMGYSGIYASTSFLKNHKEETTRVLDTLQKEVVQVRAGIEK